MKNLIRILFLLMILTSFITHTIDIDSENVFVARLTVSEIFGSLGILLTAFEFFKKKVVLKEIPKVYYAAYFLVFCFLLTVFTSLSSKSTLNEVLIVFYLITLSLSMYIAYKDVSILKFLDILTFTTFIMSFIGLYDVIMLYIEGPVLFSEYVSKFHGVSGFRYFGQAANYSFVMLSILIPLKYTDLSKSFSKHKRWYLNTTIVLCLLFLITTNRVSILISLLLAMLLFVVLNRNKKVLLDFFSIVFLGCGGILIASYLAPNLYSNLIFRFNARIFERKAGTPEASFIVQNFKDSITAFTDNVFFGSGLGAFVNNYSQFEIHGTYFKVLGETGLIGVLGYAVFVVFLWKVLKSIHTIKMTNYMYYYFPFLIGSIVAWGYNYHIRKKEFWILCTLFTLLHYKSQLYKKQLNE